MKGMNYMPKKSCRFIIIISFCIFFLSFSLSFANVRAEQDNNSTRSRYLRTETAQKSERNKAANALYEEFKKLYEDQRDLALDVAKKIILEYPDAIIIDSILNRIKMDDLLSIAGELSLSNDLKKLNAAGKIFDKWLYRIDNRIGVDNLTNEYGKAPDVLFAAGNVERKSAKLKKLVLRSDKYYSRIINDFPLSALGKLTLSEMQIFQSNNSNNITNDDYIRFMYQFIPDYSELEIIPQLSRHKYVKIQRICQALIDRFPKSLLSDQLMFWNAESSFRAGEGRESVKLFENYIMNSSKKNKNIEYIKEWTEKESDTREEAVKILGESINKFYEKERDFNIKGFRFLINKKIKGSLFADERYKMLAFGSDEFPESKIILADKENSRVNYYLLFDDKLYTKESEHFTSKTIESLNSILGVLKDIPATFEQHIYIKEKKKDGSKIVEIAYAKPYRAMMKIIKKDDMNGNSSVIIDQNYEITIKNIKVGDVYNSIFIVYTFNISKDNEIENIALSKDYNSRVDNISLEPVKMKENNPKEYFEKKIASKNEKNTKMSFEETEIYNQINDINEKLNMISTITGNQQELFNIKVIQEGIFIETDNKSSKSKSVGNQSK